MITIRPRVCAIDPALVERFKAIQPATVGHLLEFGFCDPGIQALWKPCRVVGTAVTVRTLGAGQRGGARGHRPAQAGDVLVIDRNGDTKHACWGEMTSLAAKLKGLAGTIVDGPATDVSEIAGDGLRRLLPRRLGHHHQVHRGRRGDQHAGPDRRRARCTPATSSSPTANGVLVLTPEAAAAVIEASEAREKREAWVRSELLAGRALSDISGAGGSRRARSSTLEGRAETPTRSASGGRVTYEALSGTQIDGGRGERPTGT